MIQGRKLNMILAEIEYSPENENRMSFFSPLAAIKCWQVTLLQTTDVYHTDIYTITFLGRDFLTRSQRRWWRSRIAAINT